MASLNCPKCGNQLGGGRIAGIEVEKCPRCSGAWLDHQELDDLEDQAFDVDEWKGTLTFSTEPTSLACPKCGLPMKRFRYRLFDLDLECCERLHGYWLDAGEDKRILELMKKTKADAFRALDAENRWIYFRRHIGSPRFVYAVRKFFMQIS